MEHIRDILAREVSSQPMSKDSLDLCLTKEKPKLRPECLICNDIGLIHPLRDDDTTDYGKVISCACRREEIKKRWAESLMRYCQLPTRTEGKTFETFEIRDKKCKVAKEMASRIAQGNDDVVFLTLISETGRGKSHLAIAICREWLRCGEPALYSYVPELLNDIRGSYQKDEITGQSYSQLLDRLGTIPLLVLDDLGTEKKSEWACEQLQMIIDRRARSALPLVITTNKSLDELPNDDEGRISNRLQREAWCKVVIF